VIKTQPDSKKSKTNLFRAILFKLNWPECYKTFYDRNLRNFKISLAVLKIKKQFLALLKRPSLL